MPNKYPFPYVECDRHSGPLLGYAVCVHIAEQGALIVYYDAATTAGLGAAACAECAKLASVPVEDLRLICEKCMLHYTRTAMQQ